MCLEALLVHDLHLSEPALPNFPFESEIMRQLMREPPLDKLHGLFDCHIIANFDKKMDLIRHDNEFVQHESVLRDKRTQHIDEQLRIALRL